MLCPSGRDRALFDPAQSDANVAPSTDAACAWRCHRWGKIMCVGSHSRFVARPSEGLGGVRLVCDPPYTFVLGTVGTLAQGQSLYKKPCTTRRQISPRSRLSPRVQSCSS